MKIMKNAVVGMHYVLKNAQGVVIDSSEGQAPLVFLQGHGNIIPGLEKALEGKSAGDKIEVVVEPEDGYGIQNEELVQQVPLSAFAGIENLHVGMHLEAATDSGPVSVRVTAIDNDSVTVDGNNELADVQLHFSVSIESVRQASAEEIDHGHVHGEHGHTH